MWSSYNYEVIDISGGRMMTKEELKEILDKHERWLEKSEGWSEKDKANLSEVYLREADLYKANLSKADLYEANLSRANLSKANLIGANLRGADLYAADLRGANLYEADLYGADLRVANLYGANLGVADLKRANLRRANLYGASLREANLYDADLRKANLYGTNLKDANLYGANLFGTNLYEANLCEADLKGAYNISSIPYTCPDFGEFIGWKKASGKIVCLKIPEEAKRLSATGRKCRCNKAKVLSITELDGDPCNLTAVPSDMDENFIYKVGETVSVPDFDENRWNACSAGIHFFINRQEAVEY